MLKIVLIGVLSLIWFGVILVVAYFDQGDEK